LYIVGLPSYAFMTFFVGGAAPTSPWLAPLGPSYAFVCCFIYMIKRSTPNIAIIKHFITQHLVSFLGEPPQSPGARFTQGGLRMSLPFWAGGLASLGPWYESSFLGGIYYIDIDSSVVGLGSGLPYESSFLGGYILY
jgi:hypothetical protein